MKQTIKEICIRKFAQGFTDEEIQRDHGFNKKTIENYRYKIRFEPEFQYEYVELITDHNDEMKYGFSLPIYKFNELSDSEKGIIRKLGHNKLKKLQWLKKKNHSCFIPIK